MANNTALNVIGDRYGKLVVVKFIYSGKREGNSILRKKNKKTQRFYLCSCDCGKDKVLAIGDLRQGRTASCGCSRKRFQDSPIRQTFQTYRSKCKKNKMAFDLTLDDFKNLCCLPCHYCGGSPSNRAVYRHFKEVCLYNGLDRVDNEIGYCLDNCVPCCEICNKAKRDMNCIAFIEWIRKAHRNLYVRQENEDGIQYENHPTIFGTRATGYSEVMSTL